MATFEPCISEEPTLKSARLLAVAAALLVVPQLALAQGLSQPGAFIADREASASPPAQTRPSSGQFDNWKARSSKPFAGRAGTVVPNPKPPNNNWASGDPARTSGSHALFGGLAR